MSPENIQTTSKPINSFEIDIITVIISSIIKEIQEKGLDHYDPTTSENKRTRGIGLRRSFITKIDETLRTLKQAYPEETRNKKGMRKPNPDYNRASFKLREYRRQVSGVQSADRLTLLGKL